MALLLDSTVGTIYFEAPHELGCKYSDKKVDTGISIKVNESCGPLYYIRQPDYYIPISIGLVVIISAYFLLRRLRRKP